jgi:hypothetical protein
VASADVRGVRGRGRTGRVGGRAGRERGGSRAGHERGGGRAHDDERGGGRAHEDEHGGAREVDEGEREVGGPRWRRRWLGFRRGGRAGG